MTASSLHTGYIGTAGIQSCEAVVVVGCVDDGIRAESVKGAQFNVVQGHHVAAAECRPVLPPRHQQHGWRPGLQRNGESLGVA